MKKPFSVPMSRVERGLMGWMKERCRIGVVAYGVFRCVVDLVYGLAIAAIGMIPFLVWEMVKAIGTVLGVMLEIVVGNFNGMYRFVKFGIKGK